MSNKYKRKLQKRETKLWQDIVLLLPVLFGLCIVPMIVLTHDFTIDFSQFDWFNNSALTGQIDSFGYAKGIAIVIAGIAAIVFFCYYYWKQTSKYKFQPKTLLSTIDKRIAILLGIHLVMIIISSLTSKYSDLVYNGGGYSQWQTMWVLLAYGILFFFAYYFISSERKMYILFYGLMIHLALMAYLGFMQSIGKNPLLWDWVQKAITKYSKVTGISFSNEMSDVILTFPNPNYCGTFVSLMLPIVVAFVFVKASEKLWLNILCKLAGIAMVAAFIKTLIGSGSSAAGFAMIGVAVIAIFFIVTGFFEKINLSAGEMKEEELKTIHHKQRRNAIITIVSAVVIVAAVIIGAFQTSYVQKTLVKISKGTVDARNLVSIINETADRMQVNFRNGESFELDVAIDPSHKITFKITDTANKDIPLTWNSSKEMYNPQDKRFSMLSFEPKRYALDSGIKDAFTLYDTPNNISFTFVYDESSSEWKYYTPYGKMIKLHAVERFGFQNSENMASRRGYIWSRSIPLMKTYWFKGIGPNCFIIAFPNDDFVGSKRIGNKTLLVDKPHNTFLQTYIQTGGISAIAYLLLWILYIAQCCRLFWRTKLSTNMHKIAFGIFIGSISYWIVSLTNDAVVGVQSSYWILLGLGFAVNRLLKQKQLAK